MSETHCEAEIRWLAGVAGGVLASFLMKQFQTTWSAISNAISPAKKQSKEKSDPTT
jgi:hypothetical protein